MSSTPDAVHPADEPAAPLTLTGTAGDGPPSTSGDGPPGTAGDVPPGTAAGEGAAGEGVRTGPVVSADRRRRLLTLVAALAVVVLAVDQLTKAWAVSTLTEGERTDVVGDLLGLTLLYNPGAALSIATGMTWVLTIIAVVVVVVTVRASRRIGSRAWALALGLLLGGAVGNLVDRFVREPGFARGHVVDFLAYGDLFVGNVADIAIVGAAGLIVLLALRGIGLDGSREHAPGHHRAAPQHRADPHPVRHRAPTPADPHGASRDGRPTDPTGPGDGNRLRG